MGCRSGRRKGHLRCRCRKPSRLGTAIRRRRTRCSQHAAARRRVVWRLVSDVPADGPLPRGLRPSSLLSRRLARFRNSEEQWCALVVRSGGLKQPHPTETPSEFHDNDIAFPIAAPVALTTRIEPRYRFWGDPNPATKYGDGHCVNFLEHNGRLYLYDACFGGRTVRGRPALLRKTSRSGEAYNYHHSRRDISTRPSNTCLARCTMGMCSTNRMRLPARRHDILTSLIPDEVNGQPGLTFYWGD